MAAEAANCEQGTAPSVRAGPVCGSVWLNLKSVFTGWSSLLSALFFTLMVVQTSRMKIQESPVTCDTGRIGGGDVRGSDPDHESCEDVPRLDLTALTEENNWGGEATGHLTVVFCACIFLPHAMLYFLNRSNAIWNTRLFTQTCPNNPPPSSAHGCLGSSCTPSAASPAPPPPPDAAPSASPAGFNCKRSS